MKQGKSLERLIENLEKALLGEKVIVTSPAHLKDRVTGQAREFDVVVRINQGHHEVLIAIECRDRSRKVTVNEVEAFNVKCQDSGVAQKIIVSRRGFYSTARKKAAFYGIRCLALDPLDSFRKSAQIQLISGLSVLSQENLISTWNILPVQDIDLKRKNYTLVNPKGPKVTQETLLNMLRAEFKRRTVGFEGAGSYVKNIILPLPDLILIDRTTGNKFDVREIGAKVQYDVVEQDVPFEYFAYLDSAKEMPIAEIAITSSYRFNGSNVRTLVFFKSDTELAFTIIPEDK